MLAKAVAFFGYHAKGTLMENNMKIPQKFENRCSV